MTLFKHEMKQNIKLLLIWSLVIGVMCMLCLLLYDGIEQSMEGMTEAFANMGAFSEALGMNKIGIGTMEGYYAVEITIIISLGGAMFAAMLGAGIVSKEEEGHTSEFLNTLPIGRAGIITQKYLAMLANLVVFHIVCIACILIGFTIMNEMPDKDNFMTYHAMAFIMTIEIGSICFLLSVVSKVKLTGGAIGIAVLFYIMDLMGRILPDLEHIKYITPFYYCNGSELFSGSKVSTPALCIGVIVMAVSIAASYFIYQRRDLAA